MFTTFNNKQKFESSLYTKLTIKKLGVDVE